MRPHRLILALIGAALLLVACGGDAATVAFTRVDAPTFQAEAQADPDGVIIDLRTDEEIAAGYIEGAVQLDFYEPTFAASLEELDPDVHYLVYCNSGNRSAQAIRMMKDAGFTTVTELDGGIQAWSAAGLPTVTP
jgi:phage shock protein E